MESLTETNVRAHVERLCDTDAFRASPTLCRVLRFLVDKSFESDHTPVGQRLVVEQSLGHRGDTRTRSAVAARMQIGRLRKLLADHYDTAGRDEPIRLEIPKRNYRLRFRLREAAGRTTAPLAVSQAALAIVEFVSLGVDPALAWLPPALTRNLIVALDPFRSVAVAGPFLQEPIAAAAAGANGFILVGDVRTDSAGVHVTLRLLEGWAGVLAWATDLSFQLSADGSLPAGGPPELARVADALADETGVIACQRMHATAGQLPTTLSVYEALLACWRFLLTGSPPDMDRGCQSASAAADRSPESPTAVSHAAWMQLARYLTDPDPRQRPPQQALASLERALSLAPADPWVLLHLAYALWITRDPLGPAPICRRIDGRAASGSFQGLLGALLVVSAIDLARGEALLTEAIRRVPQPLPLFTHALAVSRFRQSDLAGMGAALATSTARSDPLPIVLRMALACRGGDIRFAHRLAAAAEDLLPDCRARCEGMLRRLLHDDHVDALAEALAPLELGWFT